MESNTLQSAWYEGDKAYFLHKSDNRPVLQYVQHLRDTTDRGMIRNSNPDAFQGQHVGEIPMLEYLRITKINPELKEPAKLRKWLDTPEGSGYRIASGQKARAANIIIK